MTPTFRIYEKDRRVQEFLHFNKYSYFVKKKIVKTETRKYTTLTEKVGGIM